MAFLFKVVLLVLVLSNLGTTERLVNDVEMEGCTTPQCRFLKFLALNQLMVEDEEPYQTLTNLEYTRCLTCTHFYSAAYMIVPRDGNLTEIHSKCLFTEDVTEAHPVYRLVLYPSGCRSAFNFWFSSTFDIMYLNGDMHYPFSLNIAGRLLIPGRMLTWYNGTTAPALHED